jgi:hypothetical protein
MPQRILSFEKQPADTTSEQHRMYQQLRERAARQQRQRRQKMQRLVEQHAQPGARSFRHPSR